MHTVTVYRVTCSLNGVTQNSAEVLGEAYEATYEEQDDAEDVAASLAGTAELLHGSDFARNARYAVESVDVAIVVGDTVTVEDDDSQDYDRYITVSVEVDSCSYPVGCMVGAPEQYWGQIENAGTGVVRCMVSARPTMEDLSAVPQWAQDGVRQALSAEAWELYCATLDADDADADEPDDAEGEPNATIYEQGNGLPDVGSYIRHAPSSTLYVVDAIDGRIVTGDPRGESIRALVSEVEWDVCAEDEEHTAMLELDE
jgi:hypothetical protein